MIDLTSLSSIFLPAMATITVGLVSYALLLPSKTARNSLEARLDAMVGEKLQPVESGSGTNRAVAAALKKLETTRKVKGRNSLRARLRQAGLKRRLREHFARLAIWSLLTGAVLYFLGTRPIFIATVVLFIFLGLPRIHLNYLIKRRLKQLTSNLPLMLDAIVRGVRAGLPLLDGIKLAASEGSGPLREELQHILQDISMGLSMEEAVGRFSDRVRSQETNFFAIVVKLQSRTGGNLSESLENLSDILAERVKLQGKIRTMSSEAVTSAWIIGSLPIFVITLIFFTSPSFIEVLIYTSAGKMLLIGCAIWMGIGVVVMRQITKIEI